MTQAGIAYSINNQDISGGLTSEWIPVAFSNVHSWAYRVANGNVTITVEYGADWGSNGVVKFGEDTLVSAGTSTDFDLKGLSMPLCAYVRFIFSGTSTDCDFVFLEG